MRIPRRPWSPLLIGAFFLLTAGINAWVSLFLLSGFFAAAEFGGSTNDAILLLVGLTAATLGVAYWATGWGLLARRAWAIPAALGLAAWGATLATVFLHVGHIPEVQLFQIAISGLVFLSLTRTSVTASFAATPPARRWTGRLLVASCVLVTGFLWLVALGGVVRLEKQRGVPRVARGGIPWQTDFARAQALARDQKKPLLVVFVAGGYSKDPC